MPKYKYKAKDENGKKITGIMKASTQEELHIRLKEENKFLISAQETNKVKSYKPLKAKQISEFSRQIGTLLGSGVTLVRALNIIIKEEDLKPKERQIYENVLRLVRQGISLSDALEEQTGAFPTLFINMYRSAENAGNLDTTAMRMAIHYDKEFRLNSKIKSAMVYPKILCVLIVAVVTIIMTYVIPQFKNLFDQMETLPLTTQILLGISNFVSSYWIFLIIGVILFYVLLRYLFQVPSVRLRKDKFLLKLPIIGRLLKTIYTARFARTLSSMYASGLPIVACLNIAKKTTGNLYIESQFDEVISFVRSGGSLSMGLSKIDGFISKLTSAILVGEETGKLDSMLDSIADMLDFESERAIARLVSYLEPVMIVVMAFIVGFIIISVIQPIYGSYKAIGAQG